MARTNRKDVPPAPAASVDALDDLNLDDMFEGGDDSLFDGLDIDLDGMGELSSALDNKKEDKTLSQAGLDEMDFDLLGQSPEEASTSSKRRKTKRKSKTPPSLQDEDVSPTKKKRRTTKSSKKSKSKKDEPPPSPAGSASSKSKSKAKTSTTMPPPLPRGASGGPGMVAAAGQFGGRAQKRGSYPLPLARSSSDRPTTKTTTSTTRPPAHILPHSTSTGSKTKGRSTSISSVSSRGSVVKQQQEEALNESAQESTFCGLAPSPTLFFPFMPTLPQEPSMKKCHKLYPCLDNIHSTMNNHASSSSAAPNALLSNSPIENEAVFRLLFSDIDHHSAPTDSSSSQMIRRAALASSISAARKTLSQMDKSKLVSDLHSVCALLKKQHDFITQSVANMEQWCRNNFNEQDHAAVFGSPVMASVSARKRKSTLESAADQSIILGRNLNSLGGKVVRVKIKCTGFKEPKMSAVLVAQVPKPKYVIKLPIVERPPGVEMTTLKVDMSKVSKKATSKKRKVPSTASVSVKVKEKVPSIPAVVAPAVEEVVSYANLKPSQRRERIVDEVARQARRLEVQYVGATEGRHLSLLRQEAELQKVVEDDEILMVNTSTLWKWFEKSAFFANYTEDDVKEVLHFAWQPEINDRGILGQDVPPVHVVSRRQKSISDESGDAQNKDKTIKTSVNSLFDRLQSLLVDEGSDDETEDSDDESLDGWAEERDVSKFSELKENSATASAVDIRKGDILDLSELNLEERTYIQLRSIGLDDSPFLPSPHPVLIEEDESLSDDSNENSNGDASLMRTEKENPRPAEDDNDLDGVLQAMQRDLAQLNKLNNSRTALLQSAATAHLSAMKQSKKKEEEQTQLIAKYNQLLKKQKETKRSARQKTVKKDEDWVPW